MASGGEEGGIIQAGKLLSEGGDLVEQGTAFLEKAGQKLKECGEVLTDKVGGKSFGGLLAVGGSDIVRGARHALDHRDPIGEGWFRISNGGQNLQTACKFIDKNTIFINQIKNAGESITVAGADILRANDRFIKAGILLEEAGKMIHKKGRNIFSKNDATLIQAGGLLQNSGQLFVQGGQLIQEGNRIIMDVKFIMNSQGPLIIENGEWLREGDTIIHVPKPAEVPLGEKFPTIEPLLPDLPDIAQKLPTRKLDYPGKWDYIDFGWNDENNLDEFNILGMLQKGGFGTVYAARRKSNNEMVAIKEMLIPPIIEVNKPFLLKREKRAGKLLKHHNLCNILSAFNVGDSSYFIMEFCSNGDFFDQLALDKTFSIEVIRFYSGELIMALKYMYGQGFVHRDLKPENLMLDYRLHLKVIDFGLAKHIDDLSGCCVESNNVQPHLHRVASCAGTLAFLAPEVILNHLYPTTLSSDMYSLGCVIFNFWTGAPPFAKETAKYTQDMKTEDVLQGRYKKMPARTNPLLVDLYESLMKTKIEDRLGYNSGYDEIIEHPFYAALYAQMNFDTLINMNPPPFKTPPPNANPANPSGDQLVVPPSSSQAQHGSRSGAYVASPVSSRAGSTSGGGSMRSGVGSPARSGSFTNRALTLSTGQAQGTQDATLIGSQTTPANLYTPASMYATDPTPDMSRLALQGSGSAGSPRTPHRSRVTPEGGRVLEFAPPSDTPGVLPGPGGPPPSSTPQRTPTRGWTRTEDGTSSPPPLETTQYGAITRQPTSQAPLVRSQRVTSDPNAPVCMDCIRMCCRNPNTGTE